MTVYCCPRCRIILTFRPPEMRDHEYCFPQSDDFRGCETCGFRFCERCAAELDSKCTECGGRLHAGRSFEPTGEYRLPRSLRRLASAEERAAWVERQWKTGVMSFGEQRWLLYVIAEQARGDAGPASPDLQAKFDREFREHVERFTEPVIAALKRLVASSLPEGMEWLEFHQSNDWRLFSVDADVMDPATLHRQKGVGPPFRGKLLPETVGPLVPTGSLDQYGYEAGGVRTYESGSRVLAEWFGECWCAAGGTAFPLPAYINLPDGSQQFDLHARRWVPGAEIGRS